MELNISAIFMSLGGGLAIAAANTMETVGDVIETDYAYDAAVLRRLARTVVDPKLAEASQLMRPGHCGNPSYARHGIAG